MIMRMKIHSGRTFGYTLVEMMITLLILGVLASIAIPHYASFVRDSRRADAISSTAKIMSQQELFYGNNGNQFAGGVAQLGLQVYDGNADTTTSEEGHYSIRMTDCDGNAIGAGDNCIRLLTTAISSSQLKDTDCREFILNSHGGQTSKNSAGTLSTDGTCWN